MAVAALLLATVGCGPPRTVYHGGPILTMDATDRVVEALGVEGDRVGAVGSLDQVRAWAGSGAHEHDLAGRALLPGFIDAHSHFPGSGLYARVADLNSPPIGTVRTIDDLVTTLQAHGDTGAWFVGFGYDDTLLAERRHPTRTDMDRVSADHPVAAIHISSHLASVNTAGLRHLGIDRTTPDPPGGRIRRDDGGEPTGVLEEHAAEGALRQLMSGGTWAALRIVREGVRRYLAAGVTTAQIGLATQEMLGLGALSRLGIVPMRLVVWPEPTLARLLDTGEATPLQRDAAWFRIGATKLVADGSIQGYTAHLTRPYFVPPGADATFRGYPREPVEVLRAAVVAEYRAGHQVAIHANGDAAIDDALDAIAAAQIAHPRADDRPIIVHAQMARPDQLDRMRSLGVIPTFFVLHTYYWGDRHRDVFLGPERAATISPLASARRRGIRFTIHCDTPVVPMEPLRLLWSATQRQTVGGAVLGAEERIDVMAALRAVTIDAAYQHFQEDALGSLEVGKRADFVVLSGSPIAPHARVDELVVEQTIVGGQSVYRRP